MADRVRMGLPPGVWVAVLDQDGRIQFASHKAATVLGLNRGEGPRGKPFMDLPCWNEPQESRHALGRAILSAEMGKPQQLALTFGSGSAARIFVFEMQSPVGLQGDARSLVVTVLELSSLLAPVPAALKAGTSFAALKGFEPLVTLFKAEPRTASAAATGGRPSSPSGTRGLIESMVKLLPAAKSYDEALKIVASYLARLFPGSSGTLFLQKKGASGFHALRAWGPIVSRATRIGHDDCWAMRHSELHWVEKPEVDLCCTHNQDEKSACLPLVVRGEMIGVLAVAWTDTPPSRMTLEAVAEPLAAALAQTSTTFALLEQATRDPLTGLLNRQALEMEFTRLIHRAQEESVPASVLMIDIDHFKSFNDRFGHDAGDLVLKNVASRVNQAVRTSDLAFRYGGEEMVVLLPSCGAEEAIAGARRIQKGLADLALVNRGERLPAVTISVGVATYPHDGATPEALFQVADAGVYAAKAAGRNTIVHPVARAA
ncbi:MAG TPA: diguanylate cyclase [Nevskiaceae bacterium]|nr:diguanylate cyclase [Nevskiaceae bacterium]